MPTSASAGADRGAAPMGAITVGIVAGIGEIEKGGLRARGSNGAMLIDPLATVKG